jgi:uncharacterized integral membrane protein
MAADHAGNVDSGRNVNVKLIVLGLLAVVLVVFALLNTHEVGVDWLFDTVSAPMILVIAISAAIGFGMGFILRGHFAKSND